MPTLHEIALPTPPGTAHEPLRRALAARVSGEVRFDAGARALYAADGSNYRMPPIGVVIPRTIDDVVATVATAREFNVPILSRGSGTSLAGQCCNTAIVIDFSKYLNRIIELDPVRRIARVEPGVVLDDLRDAAEVHGLTFGPDPATHKWCTLGGMIGNNSCGVHSVMAGRTVDNIEALEVLLYDGARLRVSSGERALEAVAGLSQHRVDAMNRQLRSLASEYAAEVKRTFPEIPRRVSGYSIDQLLSENDFHVARSLVGSEGTLVTTLEATVRLIPSPRKRVLLVAGFTDMAIAGDLVPLTLSHQPIGLEAMDRRLTNAMVKKHLHPAELKQLPDGDAWMLAEFGAGTTEDATTAARALQDALEASGLVVGMKLLVEQSEQRAIWKVRDSALGAISRTPGEKDNWEGWEDAAVPPEKIGAYLRDFRQLLATYGYSGALYGHLGDGCLHNRIDWDPTTDEGVAKWLAFVDEAADLVIRYGGSISGEHGDGQARGALLPKMYGPKIMEAFEAFKTIWDPEWMMNPGKLIRPRGIGDDLRHARHPHAAGSPHETKLHFRFAEDDESFERALERCVGAGVCRKTDGVMCPSYMATRDEANSTRGRAHLLWEMMRGDVITDGWKSEEVKEALDLCLSCKGCESECPVHVDVAKYKAEFLSHYYEGRRRPRAAYAMGMISHAARIASFAPRLVNLITHAPLTAWIAKKAGGIHPAREIPKFAKQSFKSWFRSRAHSEASPKAGTVVLWADTFNNYFRPATAIAAVRVLEDAGFRVKVHARSLCCGRPLYDWGLLAEAKESLEEILDVLRDDITEGTPIVVLEPSCASVFRGEMIDLLPERADAPQLKQSVYLFGEFLMTFAPHYATGSGTGESGAATVQLHCHHRAIRPGAGSDESQLLGAAGCNSEILDGGCCGMAGAFGFGEEHYELSQQIGERNVLPALRAKPLGHTVIADGFSCREQIEQATGHTTLHLAEVLAARLTS